MLRSHSVHQPVIKMQIYMVPVPGYTVQMSACRTAAQDQIIRSIKSRNGSIKIRDIEVSVLLFKAFCNIGMTPDRLADCVFKRTCIHVLLHGKTRDQRICRNIKIIIHHSRPQPAVI